MIMYRVTFIVKLRIQVLCNHISTTTLHGFLGIEPGTGVYERWDLFLLVVSNT